MDRKLSPSMHTQGGNLGMNLAVKSCEEVEILECGGPFPRGYRAIVFPFNSG